jgi:hypothetical protein
MQYRSLAELQNKTKGAFKDNLRQGMILVEQRLKQRLENLAAQTLNSSGSRRHLRLQLARPAENNGSPGGHPLAVRKISDGRELP